MCSILRQIDDWSDSIYRAPYTYLAWFNIYVKLLSHGTHSNRECCLQSPCSLCSLSLNSMLHNNLSWKMSFAKWHSLFSRLRFYELWILLKICDVIFTCNKMKEEKKTNSYYNAFSCALVVMILCQHQWQWNIQKNEWTTDAAQWQCKTNRYSVCNNKNRYFAMNNLEIRNNQDDYVASSTKNVLLYPSVGKEQKVYSFFCCCDIQNGIGEREQKKQPSFKNCNCDEHLFINALRCEIKSEAENKSFFGCVRTMKRGVMWHLNMSVPW